MADLRIRPVDDYGTVCMPPWPPWRPGAGKGDPQVVLLSPGIYNSAFSSMSSWRARWACAGGGLRLLVDDDKVSCAPPAG